MDRVAADRPFYSGNHKKHGMNLQVITSPHYSFVMPNQDENSSLKRTGLRDAHFPG